MSAPNTRNRRKVQSTYLSRNAKLIDRILLFIIYVLSVCIVYRILDNNNFFPWNTGLETGKKISNSSNVIYYMDLPCHVIKHNETREMNILKKWNYPTDDLLGVIYSSQDRCATIKELFSFNDFPLSREEAEYPLAYGLLVYKQPIQVLFMLSAFYHPQNEYCIAVSGNSRDDFKKLMHIVDGCFNNVVVLDRPPIQWGSFEIINSTYGCLEHLSKSATPWKYFQYLSGFDIPLKTNLEMVRIFKALNNTQNIEFNNFQTRRLRGKNDTSPLRLFKSSLSALISRPAADYMRNSMKTQELLFYLSDTNIPDESFWGTLTGNVKDFPLPNAVDGQEVMDFQEKIRNKPKPIDKYGDMSYYISRYQQWTPSKCLGKIVQGSCVMGIFDWNYMMKLPHLVAHKLYLDFEPAAYFCALREFRERSENPAPFDTTPYEMMPQVEMTRGYTYANLTHPHWFIT